VMVYFNMSLIVILKSALDIPLKKGTDDESEERPRPHNTSAHCF